MVGCVDARGAGVRVALVVVRSSPPRRSSRGPDTPSTPQYAALKTLQAVSDRDWPAFQRWVDVDSVVTLGRDGGGREAGGERLRASPPAS